MFYSILYRSLYRIFYLIFFIIFLNFCCFLLILNFFCNVCRGSNERNQPLNSLYIIRSAYRKHSRSAYCAATCRPLSAWRKRVSTDYFLTIYRSLKRPDIFCLSHIPMNTVIYCTNTYDRSITRTYQEPLRGSWEVPLIASLQVQPYGSIGAVVGLPPEHPPNSEPPSWY